MIFYYDESFHDRKLTVDRKGNFNAYLADSNDSFVFALIGGRKDDVDKFITDFELLEKETKDKLELEGELKSTIFSANNFMYGVKSLKRDCKKFYYKYFEYLIKYDLLFQIGYISKTEVIVRRLINSMQIPSYLRISEKLFVYSLTKFIEQHRLSKLFSEALSNSSGNIATFISKIVDLLDKVISVIKGIKREEIELLSLLQLRYILTKSKFNSKEVIISDWNYDIVAGAIQERINETDCNEFSLIIDREESTFIVLEALKIDVLQSDSKDSAGVRAADMLAGFAGRIIRAMKIDIDEPWLDSLDDIRRELYVEKRLISNEWFNLDKNAFDLCKKISNYFSKGTYWSSFTLTYVDDAVKFFNFFNFINAHQDYEKFQSEKDMWNEYYNTYICNVLKDIFKKIQ